jgi:hypothetical protein
LPPRHSNEQEERGSWRIIVAREQGFLCDLCETSARLCG